MDKIRKRGKIVVASGACLALLGFEVSLQISRGHHSLHEFVMFLAPFPFMVYIVWRLHLNPYVELDKSGICVNNIFTRHVVPYGQVKEIMGVRSISLRVSGYGIIPVTAFDAGILGKRSRDAFADKLQLRLKNAHFDPSVARSRSITTGLPEYLGPGLSLLLLSVSLCL